MAEIAHRDIIVVGASAGGLETLRIMLSGLPADFRAKIFIVLHIGGASQLAGILARSCPLPVLEAKSGSVPQYGHVYVATPGKHLLMHGDHMLLRRGPRENQARPAIDPLFRSAAATFGSRVIGIVLSGSLSDGAAGLQAVKRCGGLAVVQDPDDALVPEMPQSALRYVDVDYVTRVAAMPALLARLTCEPAPAQPPAPLDIRLEAAIAAQELADMKIDDMLGRPSRFTCPECHGALWEIEDGSILRYRCHVGHAYTADTALLSQSEEIDRLLGTLQRSHQERAALTRRMSQHEREQGRDSLADQLGRRARDYDSDADLFRALLRNGVNDGEVVTNDEQRAAEDEPNERE